MDSGASIQAVLRLNTTDFDADMERTREAITKFRNSMNSLGKNSQSISSGVQTMTRALSSLIPVLSAFSKLVNETKSFNSFSNGLLKMSEAVMNLSNVTRTSQVGMIRIKEIMNAWSRAVNGLTLNLRTLKTEETAQQKTMNMVARMYKEAQMSLNQLYQGTNRYSAEMLKMNESQAQQRYQTQMLRKEWGLSGNQLVEVRGKLQQMESAVVKFGNATVITSADLQKMAMAEKEVSASSTQASASLQRASNSASRTASSMSRASTQTSRLGKALSSLKMMGTMVGSMLAYNFAHHLAQATNETIQSKSEMEGYFKMLHYGQGDIDRFNNALEKTVQKFQRVNKYSLGETISSIGVEFNLTTDEMIKAMDVTSMITSEYLRAGRNANEASLAVKDVLQGQFQRLSRETGVKGEQLKEAGWSGDTTDVEGLLDALRKVGEDRNWDVFATKANSLNDIVTILQNRFGEWSADMVNVVQPSIVGAFNSILSFSEGLSQSLSGLWKWLNGDSFGALATKIGMVSGAILTLMPMLTAWRSGSTLLQVANMGLIQSLGALVFGLNAEALATTTTSEAIATKLLGITAEQLEETSLVAVINGMIVSRTAETVATETATAANLGFVGGLSAVITGEAIAEGTTISLTGAIGLLTGAFLASPVGWFALAILGLASAFYVLSGGLSDTWGKMKQFNQVMEDPHSTIQPYRDEVNRLNGELEEAKSKYGENSSEVQKLNEELDDAQETLESVNSSVQHGVYWNDEYKKSFDGIDAELDKITRSKMGDLGYSDEDIDRVSQLSEVMKLGADKDYKALQVLHKQQENYGKGVDELNTKLTNLGLEGTAQADEALLKYQGNMANLQKHSAIANTTDDWWEWMWNSLYAGMDQFWIDWDNFILDVANNPLEIFNKVWSGISDFFGFDSLFKAFGFGEGSGESLTKVWDDFWKGISDGLADWEKGARDFLKPLDDLGNEVNKFISDPLGYIGLSEHLDNVWKEMVEPLIKGFTEDLPNYITESLGHWNEVIVQPIMDLWNGFWSFDWLPDFGSETFSGMKKINVMSIISGIFNLAEGIDLSWAYEFVNNNILIPIQTAIGEFMADPIGFLGGDVSSIGGLISALLGSDGIDFTWAWEWVNVNIISPISQTLLMFLADPVSFIGNMGFSVTSLLDAVFGTDIFTNIWNWTFTNIVSPLGNALWSGISQIPIVGDILMLLGLLSDENIGASEKGRMIATWIGNALTYTVSQIPILGDILRLLGVIPQAEPTANANGHGVGTSIAEGLKKGTGNLVNWVTQEFTDIANGIKQKAEDLYSSAQWAGEQIWNGVNSVLQRHSPGFIHDEVMAEFGTDIPNAISSSGSTAYSTAQMYAQNMYDGMNSVQNDGFGLGGVVDEYQTDAQTVANSSQMMGTDTTMAFNSMQTQVNASTTQMQGNVTSTYSAMQTKQSTALNSMKTQNLQAYNDMYLKSNQSLIQMRDSTSNVTSQMTGAWSHMKDQIVASANRLKSDSTAHFNTLSATIGSFYRKIQNPSNWGAGSPNYTPRARRPSAGRSAVRTIRGSRGAGVNPYTNPQKEMSIRELMRMVDSDEKVQLEDFLAMFSGGFGWNDWSPSHYSYIKSKSDNWNMKAPMILGKYQAGSGFRVGDFEGGKPTIGFSDYVATAEAIFGSVPYAFYYNSEKWGSWDNALKHGEANCSDGADALIALAHTMNPNWSTSKVHTTLKGGVGHFYAVINGKVMDTTAFQGGHGWGHLGAGVPTRRYGSSGSGSMPQQGNKTLNLTVNINEPVYGVDDLDDKILESVRKGLQEEFNDPYTVPI